MIQVNFNQSPDPIVLGPHLYFKDQLIMGQFQGDLLVDDPSWGENQFTIRLIEGSGIFSCNNPTFPYQQNQVKVTGDAIINSEDEFLVGETLIKVENFLYQGPFYKVAKFKENLSQLVEQNSPLLEVIEKLEKK